jgi:hypothetical protein
LGECVNYGASEPSEKVTETTLEPKPVVKTESNIIGDPTKTCLEQEGTPCNLNTKSCDGQLIKSSDVFIGCCKGNCVNVDSDNKLELDSIWRKSNTGLNEDIKVNIADANGYGAIGLDTNRRYYYKDKWVEFTCDNCGADSCLDGSCGECYYGYGWDTIIKLGKSCLSCSGDITKCEDYTTKSPAEYVVTQCDKDPCKVGGSNGCYMTSGMCKTRH